MSSDTDSVQNDRLKQIEKRLLTVEQAVQELGGMAKVVRVGVGIVAVSFGVDITGMM